MKIIFLVILSLFFFNTSSGQENYEFIGVLKLNSDSNSLISYRLNFKNSNGIIEGYSMTDMYGPHETKNIITGNYDKENKKLTIVETGIVYTKSDFNEEYFCMINLSTKLSLDNKTDKITGDFKSKFPNGDVCLTGTLNLINVVKLQKIASKFDSKIEKSKNKEVQKFKETNFNAGELLDSLSINTLSKNENLNLFWNSEEVNLSFWDIAKEDGDKINVFHNGKLILRNYIVLNEKHYQSLKLLEGANVFKVVALNEGNIAPNTTQIQFSDVDRNIDLSATLMKGEFATITIIKRNN